MNIRSQSLWILALLLCVVQTGWAEDELSSSLESEEQPVADSQPKPTGYPESTKLIHLTVQPAVPPVPALKYSMRHRWTDQYEGNAAPLYYRAILLMQQNNAPREDQISHWENIAQWTDAPIDTLPVDEVKRVLDHYQNVFQETRYGALRQNCNWGMPIREQQHDMYSILLPAIQECRSIARLLALKIHYEISQGNIEQAVEDLRIGFTLAKHVGGELILVSGLVGVAISNIMLEQVYVLMEHADTPNLSWMLASLPDPVVDFSHALEFEKNSVAMVFPQLDEAEKDGFSDAYWDTQLNTVLSKLAEYSKITFMRNATDGLNNNAKSMLFRVHVYSQSKRAKSGLIKYGYAETVVEKMSKARAILLYTKHAFAELRDDLLKYSYFPYHEALPYNRIGEEEFRLNSKAKEIIPLASTLLPAINQVQAAQALSRRKVAVLRTIEAIRWHAALNDGKLPSSLDQITVIPVPSNPMTGKPFNYRIQNQSAIIEMTDDYQGKKPVVIELTLKK
ncbi:MAG: hypothetical protein COA78_04650 [Blastopirellula sp.]|nr:MAG: hypothetical protein COA78_04650 [Blastopirellula sp.]